MQGLLNNHLQQRKANILAAFGVNIVKGNMNDNLEKGGEGSRGGKIIGHFKSGKPIYAAGGTHDAHLKFSVDEHRDAAYRLRKLGYKEHAASHDKEADRKYSEVGKKEKEEKIRSLHHGAGVAKSHGEGSRGGKVIGHTKSGKPIYAHFEHGHKDFTAEEHRYAAKMHANRTQGVSNTEDAIVHENKQERSHRRAAEKLEKNDKNTHEQLKQHLNNDEEHFYRVVSKHYEPSDDGESEHTMLQNLSKHKNVNKILTQLGKKK